MKSLFTSLLFAYFLASFSMASAQIPSSIGGVDVIITPPNPVPGKSVDINIKDYSSDISSAYITWVVNGKKVAEGVGKNDMTITAPDLGKTSNVSVLIQTVDGKNIQKSVVIKSGSVDIVLESQGYAPPLFKGKQVFAYEDSLRVIAVPHLASKSGVEIDPGTLVYSWKQDSTNLQDQGGYGKQSILITGGVVPRTTSIYVSVSTRDGSETASGVMTINPKSPSLVFYQEDPLYGVLYNLALGARVAFSNQEITLLAAPFSFNVPNLIKNDLEYGWTINGVVQSDLSNSRSVTLRVQDTRTDNNYPVQLQLQNTKDILQGASGAVTVMFIANKNNNASSF